MTIHSPTPEERLIVALDFNSRDEALRLVDTLEDSVKFYKVGLELFVTAGHEVIRELQSRGHKIFLDLKIDDVVETITRTVRQISKLNVDLMTILGSSATAKAAKAGRGESTLPRILMVTLLTSLNEDDLAEMGLLGFPGAKFESVERFVAWRGRMALDNGCDGLITSGTNVRMLRETLREKNPIIVCPGIRPGGVGHHEHKRPYTPYDAIADGADYIVVGRPIRDAENRIDSAKEIVGEIERGLKNRGY